MILTVNPASSMPLYAQIADQIRRAIANGVLRAGEPLPSLRETVLKLRVNHLTISKAYRELENDGLVVTRHGLGSFVAPEVRTRIEGHRREALARGLDSVLVDACQMQVSFDEVREILEERIDIANEGFARDYAKAREQDGK